MLRRRRPRAGTWSAAAGLLSSLGLFLCFLFAGQATGEAGSTAWTTPLGFVLRREEALLVTLPLSCAAFVVGYLVDLRLERSP